MDQANKVTMAVTQTRTTGRQAPGTPTRPRTSTDTPTNREGSRNKYKD